MWQYGIVYYRPPSQCLSALPQVSPEFKAKVMEILSTGNFENLRSSKMSQDELLALLAAFNAHGIHFV